MTIQFPNNLDTLTNPNGNDQVSVVSHAEQHSDANDAIEALEAKVGVDNSAVTSSLDFKLSSVADGDTAVSNAAYTTDSSATSALISGLQTSDSDNVKLTGAQTVGGVKTFTDSPVVPDPTDPTDATNKQWVEGYVQGTGKETVGLFTQGSFIDTIETNLSFNIGQTSTETALTGAPTFTSLDSLNGTNFITAYGNGVDLLFGEYSLSGSTFTPIFTQVPLSSVNAASPICKYIDANNAVAVYKNNSSDSQIYFSLLKKVGTTWSEVDSDIHTLPGSSSSTIVRDVYVSGNDIYAAISYVGQDIRILKATAVVASNIISMNGTWTVPVITEPNATSNAKFESSTGIYVAWGGNNLRKYSFSSGSYSQLGNTYSGSFGYSAFLVLDNNKVIQDRSTQGWETLSFDGTDFSIESRTDNNPTDVMSFSQLAVVSPTRIVGASHDTVLIGSGIESYIEDLSSTGHIGYMTSSSASNVASSTQARNITISGSTSNDGTYQIDSCTENRVIVDTATPLTAVETSVCMFSSDLSDRSGYEWTVKGSNYYLGIN